MEQTGKEIEKQVWEGLKGVIDPELNVSIVDLGLVYKVEVSKKDNEWWVEILMTLTSPGCPLAGSFNFLVRDGIRGIEGVDPEERVKVNLTFDPPWTQAMMTPELQAEFGVDEW